MSKPINGKEQIARVAAISASDDEVGTMVADAMEKVSRTASSLKNQESMKTELTWLKVCSLTRSYLSAYMCTDMDKIRWKLTR